MTNHKQKILNSGNISESVISILKHLLFDKVASLFSVTRKFEASDALVIDGNEIFRISIKSVLVRHPRFVLHILYMYKDILRTSMLS